MTVLWTYYQSCLPPRWLKMKFYIQYLDCLKMLPRSVAKKFERHHTMQFCNEIFFSLMLFYKTSLTNNFQWRNLSFLEFPQAHNSRTYNNNKLILIETLSITSQFSYSFFQNEYILTVNQGKGYWIETP